MAVINVRVDDRVRDELKSIANEIGLTLSDYVRELLLESIRPITETTESKAGDLPAPETLSFMDRKTLSLLHRILARVLPEEANDSDGDRDYQLERAKVLEQGFAGEYWMEAAGFSTELTKRDSRRVMEILDMFRAISYSKRTHEDAGTPIDSKLSGLTFEGFDHNDALESQMADYVDHLIDNDRWTEIRETFGSNDNGNSHMQMLGIYDRMLAEFRRIMDSRERDYRRDDYLLSPEELTAIAHSRTHPSHRRNN